MLRTKVILALSLLALHARAASPDAPQSFDVKQAVLTLQDDSKVTVDGGGWYSTERIGQIQQAMAIKVEPCPEPPPPESISWTTIGIVFVLGAVAGGWVVSKL